MDLIKSLIGLGGVAVIVALVQVMKPFIKDSRFYPILAIGFGLIINVTAALVLGITGWRDIVVAIIQGVLAGLSASGAYSAGATFAEVRRLSKPAKGENRAE